jgi:hypothetical protein
MSPAERRLYINERLHTDWGWVDWQKSTLGLSYGDIAKKVASASGELFARSTIMRDIEVLRIAAKVPGEEELTEAQRLLRPENFPEWRQLIFPGYETPTHQLAAYWLMYCMTFKQPVPIWVFEYLDYMDPDPDRALPEYDLINEVITSGTKFLTFELLLAPRHGKTKLSQHAMVNFVCIDPDIAMMWANGTQKKTQTFIKNYILPVLEHHEDLNRLYGPFYNPGHWSSEGFIVAKRKDYANMPTIMPFGLGGSIRSYDSDMIMTDDMSDEVRARNETVTAQDAQWTVTELMQRREPHTPLFILGSHLPVDTGDYFVHLEEHLEALKGDPGSLVIIKKIPAHDFNKCDEAKDPLHEGCIIWPSVRGKQFLETKRKELGDVMYDAVFNQIPRSDSMEHFPAAIIREDYEVTELDHDGRRERPERIGMLDRSRTWKEVPTCCHKRKVLVAAGFDPAVSESKEASFTAIGVLGACPYCGRRYTIDYFALRQSPELHPQLIDSFLTAYPEIERIRIENNAYQKALARDPRMEEIAARNKVWIEEWRTDERKWDPALGIPQMGRHVKNGLWSIPYAGPADHEYGEDLIRAFIRWPKRPNDLIMAFWLAELSLLEMIEEYRNVKAEIMPGTEMYRTEWHDELTVSVNLDDIHTEYDEWEYV